MRMEAITMKTSTRMSKIAVMTAVMLTMPLAASAAAAPAALEAPIAVCRTIRIPTVLAEAPYDECKLVSIGQFSAGFIVKRGGEERFVNADFYSDFVFEDRPLGKWEACTAWGGGLGVFGWAAPDEMTYTIDGRATTIRFDGGVDAIAAGRRAVGVQKGEELRVFFEVGPTFGPGFSDEEKENLRCELIQPNLSLLLRDGDAVYYYESSNFNYRPYQTSDIVVWRYNGPEKGGCQKLESFSSIFFDAAVDHEGGRIVFDLGDGENVTVRTK